jgi:hypothetical protein
MPTSDKQRIETQAKPEDQESMLNVLRVLAQFAYNDRNLLAILGGQSMLSEMPFIQEMLTENSLRERRNSLIWVLQSRFGTIPQDLHAQIQLVTKLEKLESLIKISGSCADLEAFRIETQKE